MDPACYFEVRVEELKNSLSELFSLHGKRLTQFQKLTQPLNSWFMADPLNLSQSYFFIILFALLSLLWCIIKYVRKLIILKIVLKVSSFLKCTLTS